MTPNYFPALAKRTRNTGECWEWTGAVDSSGYGLVSRNRRLVSVHRLAFQMAYGYLPEVVAHRCDNRRCWNPAHLFATDHNGNRQDCVAKGRQAQGERNGRAKLTAEQVEAIRQHTGTLAATARQYGVSARTIRNIRNNSIWRDR